MHSDVNVFVGLDLMLEQPARSAPRFIRPAAPDLWPALRAGAASWLIDQSAKERVLVSEYKVYELIVANFPLF